MKSATMSLYITLFTIALFFTNVLAFVAMYVRSRKQSQTGEKRSYGFFHPYCNAAGGGERVLWTAILTIQENYPDVAIVIYTGDTDATPDEIIANAERVFQVRLLRPVQFVYLQSRFLLEAKYYPVFTLLLQSLASVLVGLEAILKFTPDVYFDTMGFAFTLPVFKMFGGCQTASYVHFSTISTDMLCAVHSRRPGVTNREVICRSRILSIAKLIYYKAFAAIYGWIGCLFSDTTMVNSSWTNGHVSEIWGVTCHLLYPPCSVEKFYDLKSIANPEKEFRIVSLAQFRPEKDHLKQLAALKVLQKQLAPEEFQRVKLVLVGSCRNQEDQERVQDLKLQTDFLELSDNVEFAVDVQFSELKKEMAKASAAIHTMWNEHFGIAVVECLAAGLITVVHDSGGPKEDIIRPGCGFTAITAEDFAKQIAQIIRMTPSERQKISDAAKRSMDRFTEGKFKSSFLKIVRTYIENQRPAERITT
ncbi:GDP-Man:Man(3)GlcNAc(2)-PP-Dol alpha-1,2-mannosyltransferase-like [Varroa destructor]|uniref:GDP-Man:Man(3)GlcNAc(2)-PP-Dol alpha-1,2-mannosyltransferase n=1 Tax=Varroa destructor TaxID=109461 RepID=A0A7M7J1M1_VARDE|nr:GDP-Man:Man(3)GlcNAc(2)-PP-Dol alpha-1,2-mannosyltransferase-like [Varroa destructor]XP_022644830.1 GDP-Man:Man(3)GlcNAc(2)-PP-Dol alpha-1,2-mannosyltransferase-like [Varroa destructor]